MRNQVHALRLAVATAAALVVWPLLAGEAPTKMLLEVSAPDAAKRLTPSLGAESQASVARNPEPAAAGLVVAIQPGKDSYPGVNLKPEGTDAWDLSSFGHVEARVVNTGAKLLGFNLRVDNAGDWRDGPWNCESLWLKPGATGKVSVIFGYSYGQKPGFALNPAAVVNILMFTMKSDAEQSFRLESLVAGGPTGEKPPVDPKSVRIKPKGGVLLGRGVAMDAATQIGTNGGATALAVDQGSALRVAFPAGRGDASVSLKPPLGRWNLTDACEIRVIVRNEGTNPVTPRLQAVSDSGKTDLAALPAALAPGAEQEIVILFAPAVPGRGVAVSKVGFFGPRPGTGTSFGSDAVGAITITAERSGAAVLLVKSVVADAPPARLPDWLGQRPPVEGDWARTFDDPFEGQAIDLAKWNIYGPNYWDKKSHWSKTNLLVGGGLVKLHFEKRRGFHNDNANQPAQNLSGTNVSDYACGYLDTYGKWVQRYGYFEARVRLPTAPGLWPTFWMMPDRGVAAGPQGKRADTGHGGMELDIMEHLTRWGPHRYNNALHWDGYGKDHTSIGSTCNYVQADKDGYITSGMLWTPGSVIWYCNGQELFRWEDARVSTVPSHFILEMTTGGWDNNAVDDAQLPADYVIDYVRAWQRRDLASEADGVKTTAAAPAAPAR